MVTRRQPFNQLNVVKIQLLILVFHGSPVNQFNHSAFSPERIIEQIIRPYVP
jgi:hypothetical protein